MIMKLPNKFMTQCATIGCLVLLLQQTTLGEPFNNTTTAIPIESSAPTVQNDDMQNPKEMPTIDYTNLDVEGILLPRNLYILQGSQNVAERYNIYHKNAVLALLVDYQLDCLSPYGISLPGRWNFQSGSTTSIAPFEPFDITLNLKQGITTTTKTASVEVVNTSNTTPVRLLAIGDSLTRSGIYLEQVQKKLPNVTTVGSRVYPGETTPREGRGGWTLEKYFNNINSSELDSPFVFPVNVSGSHYKGNTRDWKNICYTNPKHSTYNGFQKIARGWNDQGAYLYNENGYYKYPVVGDVMVDPSLPYGKQWVEWNGRTWAPMAVQPTEFEFNFTKYMARFSSAYKSGAPTHVSILLGANDFNDMNGLLKLKDHMDKLNTMIDSIHAYNPNIKIILCTPTPSPNTNIVTDSRKSYYYTYDRCMKIAAYYLLKTFDNDESLARGIYIAPMNLTLDITSGFDYKEKYEIIDGVNTKVVSAANGIHPNNTVGQPQMGDTLAAVIQKYR